MNDDLVDRLLADELPNDGQFVWICRICNFVFLFKLTRGIFNGKDNSSS